MLVGIISDTHMPRGARRLTDACVERLLEVDLIMHAGDVMTAEALEAFGSIGPPLVAVHGNVDTVDLRQRLPAERTIEAGGARIAMVHDAGPASGRLERLRGRFPEADAVVFGHSHIPLHEQSGGFQIFNPGSPTERRRAPTKTMGLARADRGRVSFELIDVG